MTLRPSEPQPYYNPASADDQTSNLNTLSIFYFILAGLMAIGSCLPLIYIGFGALFVVLGFSSPHNGDAVASATVGGVIGCLGVFVLALICTLAFLNFLTGKSLRQRKRLTLCYVMAGLICISFPLGTILGVFTFVVLSKPGVKESFT